MPDREKVISAYECVITRGKSVCECGKCDYYIKDSTVFFCDNQRVLTDALAMLKEQEAVEPIISESYRTNSGRMSRRKAWCGACGIGINFDAKFCDHCGKAVKWE